MSGCDDAMGDWVIVAKPFSVGGIPEKHTRESTGCEFVGSGGRNIRIAAAAKGA